eukprot:TRINITY_DN2476_c0_g1_i1.p1 TRINITY_DN2476_c0_g1~~TRINITY_DN2476_c0_g1_i1.p1  ORF type:complete len:157 (-),score=14.87 TRINITY_DN2476_c0_g1_i1:839-1309(-)
MNSIDVPLTPEMIRTPKEFKDIDWNTMGSERSKDEPNMTKIGPDDAIIVKKLQPGKQDKGSSVTTSLYKTKSEDRVEMKKIDVVEEESSNCSKLSSTTSSLKSKASPEQSKTLSTTNSEWSSSEPIFDSKTFWSTTSHLVWTLHFSALFLLHMARS